MKAYLYQDVCNHQELQSVLLGYFGSLAGGKFTIKDTNHTIELHWDYEENIIEDITTSNNFPSESLLEIQKHISSKLIDNVKEEVSQRYVYSHVKLNNYFNYKDVFQIIPLPDHLPQSNVMYDTHPFIIQFKYLKTDDVMINIRRQSEACIKYVRLLNVFLKNEVVFHHNTKMGSWGSNFESGQLAKFQEGYHHIDFTPFNPTTFYDTSKLNKIKEVNSETYYGEFEFPYQEIQIPDDLSSSLDLALDLKGDEWDKFYRACTWVEMADKTWHYSKSSSFVGYVSAIESFLEQPDVCKPPKGCGQLIASSIEGGETCSVCNQPRLKLNSRFRQFLVDNGISKDLKREQDLLYRTRSGLTHGGFLFISDISPFDGMGAKSFYEGQLHRRLHYICQIVIYNWLRKKS